MTAACSDLASRHRGPGIGRSRDVITVAMVRREDAPVPPDTARDMGLRILSDKGRLEGFIKLNQG